SSGRWNRAGVAVLVARGQAYKRLTRRRLIIIRNSFAPRPSRISFDSLTFASRWTRDRRTFAPFEGAILRPPPRVLSSILCRPHSIEINTGSLTTRNARERLSARIMIPELLTFLVKTLSPNRTLWMQRCCYERLVILRGMRFFRLSRELREHRLRLRKRSVYRDRPSH